MSHSIAVRRECQGDSLDAGDTEDRGPLAPRAPGVVAREDLGLAIKDPGSIPFEEDHVVMIWTDLAEAVNPEVILFGDEHLVAVVARLDHGRSSRRRACKNGSGQPRVCSGTLEFLA